LLLQREIKNNVLEVIDKTILQDKIIVDLDMRSSGVQVGKRSFMNLEITLYVKNQPDFKSPILRDNIKTIITSVYQDNIKGSGFFKIHLCKNPKQKILEEV